MLRNCAPLAAPLAVLLIVCMAGASCRSVRFYSQAVGGQAEILHRARPIDRIQRDARTTPKLKEQLTLVQAMRTFAHDRLKLPTHRQYRNYADLKRKYAVWNVYATPEFSLEAKTWRYPVVGSLKYRGFFSEEAAKAEGEMLKEQGYDVLVGGVRVYSTLGWFSDPVLNTFVEDEETQLAETLFHELTHARFFVSGDTDFNEAYATASGQEGVRQWLKSRNDINSLAQYERELAGFGRVLALLKRTRATLETLYEQEKSLPVETMRQRKAAILDAARDEYAAMKRRGECDDTFDRFFGKQLNNARLVALATYYDLVPAFQRLFEAQGRDWEKFHQAVEAMRPLSKQARREKLGMPEAE